jgi:hypothetical protein
MGISEGAVTRYINESRERLRVELARLWRLEAEADDEDLRRNPEERIHKLARADLKMQV